MVSDVNERLVLGGIRSRANGRKRVSATAVLGQIPTT